MGAWSSRREFIRDGGKSLLCASAFPLSLRARIEDAGGKLKTGAPAKELIDDLSGFIPGLMKKENVPGLSISIIRDARILWSQGFGIKGKSSGEPVSASTVFEAASLSKPAFAYGVLKMCESGRLGLDTPLTEYRRTPLIANEPRLRQVTARMVLSHSSGLPHGRAPGTPISLRFEPGERFAYSATGFQYLQTVVELLSGQPLSEFMKASVLDPLGMRESSFGSIDRYSREAAEGHDRDGNPGLSGNGRYLNYSPEERAQQQKNFPEYSYPSSSAGLYTTAADYARFVSEIIEPSAKDRYHLSDEMTAEMLRPHVRVSDAISWGLGWGIERSDAGDAFWHWGDWGVFRNFAIAFKKQKIGVVVLTNSFNGPKAYREIVPRAIGGNHPAFSWVNGYRP